MRLVSTGHLGNFGFQKCPTGGDEVAGSQDAADGSLKDHAADAAINIGKARAQGIGAKKTRNHPPK